MKVTDSFLCELRKRNDLAATVSTYMPTEPSGSGYICRCPFHKGIDLSFHIFSDTQTYQCFGCGASGDVISFISRIEKCGCFEAVRLLAERVELDPPNEESDDKTALKRARMLEMNLEAARYYRDVLHSDMGKRGMDYLLGRQLTLGSIRKYGLGYAPGGWHDLHHHLKNKGFTETEMAEAALIVHKGSSVYDKFRERVMFPIIDIRGNVIGFGGRTLEKTASVKYINTDETLVFHKRENLFSLNFAEKSADKRFILCEGYMDVITMNQAGFDGAVATLGTAVTPQQAKLIKERTGSVVISYDSDEAGQKAALRAIKLFSDIGVEPKVLTIPDAKDPDEYIKKFGPVRFGELLNGLPTATEYVLSRLLTKGNMSDVVKYLAGLTDSEREKQMPTVNVREPDITANSETTVAEPNDDAVEKPVSELSNDEILRMIEKVRKKRGKT